MNAENIVYFHGWGSQFDSSKKKIQFLKQIANVDGPNIDWTRSSGQIIQFVSSWISNLEYHPNLVVGTSMGGWLASHIGSAFAIPFVAINPAVSPSNSLQSKIGVTFDWNGNSISLKRDAVMSYAPFNLEGKGIILLDEEDEIFDSKLTYQMLKKYYNVKIFSGGNHRFQHMEEALDHINIFMKCSNSKK